MLAMSQETLQTIDPAEGLVLDGKEIQIRQVGFADSQDSTFVWVPELRLVVAGDIVYNDVHCFLGEAVTREKQESWVQALREIAALEPKVVVARHKREGVVDAAENVGATIEYITDWQTWEAESAGATELFERVMEKHPGRVNPFAAWSGALSCMKR